MTDRASSNRREHDRFRLLAAQAVDGWIHPDDAAELEAHLAGCPACGQDQQAMVQDHLWLATPSRVASPDPRIREAVLGAARAPGVPRVGQAPRPWSALIAAGLIVGIVGAGVLLGLAGPDGPGGRSSPSPPFSQAAPTGGVVSPSALSAIARGRFVPDNEFAIQELDVEIALSGLPGAGSATVVVASSSGESWVGEVKEWQYWIDEYGPGTTYVAFMTGCKRATSCEAFHLMLVDGRDGDGSYKMELDFYSSLDAIDLDRDHAWYRLSSGEVAVSGPMPLGETCAPRPAAVTSHWRLDGNGLDEVGGADLVPRGGAFYAEGYIYDGQALSGPEAYGEVADEPVVRVGAGDFTAALWVRFEDLVGEQTLIEQWRDATRPEDARGWTVTKLPTNELVFVISGPGGGSSAHSAPLDLAPGGWHHVAARRSGETLELFLDGVAVAEGVIPAGLDASASTPLLIGRRGDDRGYFVRGAIDDVLLSVGTALPNASVEALVRARWAGTCRI